MPCRVRHRILERSPLVLVLAEVRFSPVLAMKGRLSEIQEELRASGFPGFESAIMHELQLAADQVPKITTAERWLFSDKTRATFIVLTQSSLALEITSYSTFESFLKSVELALRTIQKHVGPALSERVGLRYVNIIEPDSGRNLSYYLKPSMMALEPDALGAENLLWHIETVGSVAPGQVKVRLSQRNDTSVLPPDLLTPELASYALGSEQLRTVLDIDCSSAQSSDFDVSDLIEKLWMLHEYTDRAFTASVTAGALKAWGEKFIEHDQH